MKWQFTSLRHILSSCKPIHELACVARHTTLHKEQLWSLKTAAPWVLSQSLHAVLDCSPYIFMSHTPEDICHVHKILIICYTFLLLKWIYLVVNLGTVACIILNTQTIQLPQAAWQERRWLSNGCHQMTTCIMYSVQLSETECMLPLVHSPIHPLHRLIATCTFTAL